ncbi:MAG: glycosyl hydrolase family 2 [Muribaculaceae bacterium]|nr:glycosyl hydrolase family 2 [Muribaculaceae bacterium]
MIKRLLLSALSLWAMAPAIAQTWPEISPEMRPGTRWWWLGSAVDSVNLKRSIEEYAATGLGSLEITPIYGVKNNEHNEIGFLSPEWMAMLRTTEEIAGANGILVDMNQGTGWPFGGPEVSQDDAACKAIFLIDTVERGLTPVKTLPEKERRVAKLIAESRRPIDGGREEVVRAFQSRTFQTVKRAAPGGEGYVMDHFDRGAVARYLSKFDKAFKENGIPYPHNFFNDSYEVFGANWTPTLFDEFEKRRGYRLQDKLPELLGLIDDGNETLCDYRETLGELLLENFTQQWADWAHQRGTQVRNQAHGSPANLIDVYAAVDVPEIEGFGLSDFGIKGLRTDLGFTRKNDSDVSMLKYASSAAHITGKPLTSSETFTWLTEHFRTSLSQMKPDLDLMFTCGVNHVFFHGTTYSPFEDPWPGWKFYASIDMSPTNTIWHDAPALMDYITRCQSMLQQGQPDNDFLVYLPVRDMWHRRLAPGEKGLSMGFSIHSMGKLAPDFIRSVMKIDSLGYDCDYISDKYLMSTRYDDGMLVTDAGTKYKALLIPGSGRLPHALKSHLDSLKADGAKIIYGVDSDRMQEAVSAENLRISLGLRTIRRKTDDGYIYFISNLTPDDVDSSVSLATPFSDAVWFDPMNGDIFGASLTDGKINVALRSGESRILRTYSDKKMNVASRQLLSMDKEYDLSSLPWTLEFEDSYPEVAKKYKLKTLKPWTALGDPALDELAGTGIYTTHINIPKREVSGRWQLDLGDLRESARIYVNDKYIGTVWAAPFTIDFNDCLKAGDNEIRIEVTNLPANRIAAMDRRGVPWRKFKEINIVDINYRKTDYSDWETLPSGLNSTVTLRHFR